MNYRSVFRSLIFSLYVVQYEFKQRELSDFDGITQAQAMCPRCKLSVDEMYMTEKGLCKACENYSGIVNMTTRIKTLTQASILTAIFIFIVPLFVPELSMSQFLIPVLVIGFAPVILISIYQLNLHMRGIQREHRINPLLAGYVITGNHAYYDEALKIWNETYESMSEALRESILHNLLVYVIISSVDSPDTVLEDWSVGIGLEGDDLFRMYIDNDKELLLSSIAPSLQFGYLPTIWPYVEKLETDEKKEFIDQIESIAKQINDKTLGEEYDKFMIEIFTDEVFVISDGLEPYLDEYPNIKRLIDEYDIPEIPQTKLGMMKALTLATNEILVKKQQAEMRMKSNTNV